LSAIKPDKILSASRLGFPEPDTEPLCVPTWGRDDLAPGQAWCLRGRHTFDLSDWMRGESCAAILQHKFGVAPRGDRGPNHGVDGLPTVDGSCSRRAPSPSTDLTEGV
jgi:hypothetical protein